MNISKIKRSSQSIDNFSFDEEYLQSAVEVLVENPEGTALVRQKAIATEAKQDELIGNFTRTNLEGSAITVGTTSVELTFTGTETTGDMSAVSFDCHIRVNALGSRQLYSK